MNAQVLEALKKDMDNTVDALRKDLAKMRLHRTH
jgi:ribosome recycling factor